VTLFGPIRGKLGSPKQRATVPMAVVWCGVPVIYAVILLTPSVALPGDDLGLRRFETPGLSPDVSIGQTFRMTADGLYAVEVFAASIETAVSGIVLFDLYEIPGEGLPELVRAIEVSAVDLLKTRSHRFTFPPILNSEDRFYRFELRSAVTSPSQGIAFLATRGERYAGGSLHINNQSRWADMAFHADAPAPSIWRLLMTLRETHPVRGNAVAGSFVAVWLLLGLVPIRIARISDARHVTGSSCT